MHGLIRGLFGANWYNKQSTQDCKHSNIKTAPNSIPQFSPIMLVLKKSKKKKHHSTLKRLTVQCINKGHCEAYKWTLKV